MTHSRPKDPTPSEGPKLPPPLPKWDPELDRRKEKMAILQEPGAPSGQTATDMKIRRLLAWCGAARTPALVATSNPPRVLEARMIALRGEQLSIAIEAGLEEARAALIGDESPCVLFSLDRRSTAFHAQVHQITNVDGEVIATFGIPMEITQSDSRSASRITVATSCDLSITLSHAGQTTEVMARDLSISGAQTVLLTEDASFHAGQTIAATVALGSRSITLPAQVRRRKGLELGLLFPDSTSEKGPPEVLRQILKEVDARRPTPLAPETKG